MTSPCDLSQELEDGLVLAVGANGMRTRARPRATRDLAEPREDAMLDAAPQCAAAHEATVSTQSASARVSKKAAPTSP